MIGGLTMKSFYKNKFALSDQGAEALTKASISSFFVYCINMVPAFIIMMLIDELVLEVLLQSFK